MVERVGWVFAILVLLAALLGLLGPGPLSKAKAASPDGALSLQYYRLVRYEAPMVLAIEADGKLAKEGELRLWLDRKFLEMIELKHVDPEPASVQIDGERHIYAFKTGEVPGNVKVFFHTEPSKFGKAALRFGVVNGPEVHFKQFYFP